MFGADVVRELLIVGPLYCFGCALLPTCVGTVLPLSNKRVLQMYMGRGRYLLPSMCRCELTIRTPSETSHFSS